MASSAYLFIGGASGGIFALCAAHFANVTLNWNEMNHPVVHVFLVLCYLSSEIFGWYKSSSASDTVYTGMGGLIAGILLGILFLRNVIKEQCEVKVQRGALILYIVFVLMCIAGIGYRSMDRSAIVSIVN
ncbi:Peptidase S54 [Aphelenchoides avenae]|nr:Peptidase S54 [Aphelenchus avenae]